MNTIRLACTLCSKKLPFEIRGKCECGGTLLVEYDLEKIRYNLNKDHLIHRASTMWRYFELLPVRDHGSIISLGEGWTPLLRLEAAAKRLPLRRIWMKREEQNPTGSFKARGFSMAISLLHERGITKAAVASNGNAASSLAAYTSRAGMQGYAFIPQDCPAIIVEECRHYGAHTILVDGLIHDAGQIVDDGKCEQGWANAGTLKEPGRVEGKKTMGLELAEQLHWKLPDVIIYPTGGGSGIIGIWKAFCELKELGWIEGDLPRMVSVQEVGCSPIVEAMASGSPVVPPSGPVSSNPTGMRVPNPPDGNLIVSILRKTDGTAVKVSGEEITSAQLALGKQGISSSPEGAATWAGLLQLCDTRWIQSHETVVLFNTSHAMKYVPWTGRHMTPVVRNYQDWRALQQ